jgi:hypothetical protein
VTGRAGGDTVQDVSEDLDALPLRASQEAATGWRG